MKRKVRLAIFALFCVATFGCGNNAQEGDEVNNGVISGENEATGSGNGIQSEDRSGREGNGIEANSKEGDEVNNGIISEEEAGREGGG
ncbi:MAG: hypothetical protein JJ975_05905 [Bacteroidia bacterium]|nr:hypothetical protein [Bacteroidia bacterium]